MPEEIVSWKIREHFCTSQTEPSKKFQRTFASRTYKDYKKIEDILSIMSNLQPNCCLKVDFQKVDQHAGGKWLIHHTKCRKDNQLQSMKLSCWMSKLCS